MVFFPSLVPKGFKPVGKSVVYIISLVVQSVTKSSQVQQLVPKVAVSNS